MKTAIVRIIQKPIAAVVHAQMREHQREKAIGHDVVATKGFTGLKPSASTAKDGQPTHDCRQTVEDRAVYHRGSLEDSRARKDMTDHEILGRLKGPLVNKVQADPPFFYYLFRVRVFPLLSLM